MPEILIQSPDKEAIVAEHEALLSGVVFAPVITSQGEHGAVLENIKAVTRAIKLVKAKFLEPAAKSHSAWKAIVALRKECLEPLEARKSSYNGICDVWEAKQKAIAEEKRRKLEAEARAREEKERKDAEDRQIDEAAAAEESGDPELANEILEAPPAPVAPAVVHVPQAVAKVEGVGTRTTWKAEIHDLMALVKHVAVTPTDLCLLDASTKNLNSRACAAQGALRIPGVRAVSETVRSVRTA